MNQDIVIIRTSPMVFLKRVAIVEFFFALLPFALVALSNLRSEYGASFLSGTVSYTLFVAIAITSLQILILAVVFFTWYFPTYQVNERQIAYRRGELLGNRKLIDTPMIAHIEFTQGAIARRLNYGTLVISSSGSGNKVCVKNIPDPAYYAELIQHFVEPHMALPALFEPQPARELIAGGGHQHVEFKSSLMWNYRRQVANKDLYEPVMKNITAFMNSRGGAVLIGVGDEGEILGLEPDLRTLRKPNLDGFENVFKMAFNKMIGAEFRPSVDVIFPEIDGKAICLVTVRPSTEPAYLVHMRKNLVI